MASYAGAYGAGGASDELHKLLSERFERDKFAEVQRRGKSDEDFRERERGDTNEYRRSESEARNSRDVADRSERGEDRIDRRRMFDTEQQRHVNNDEVRRKERAEDREWGLDDREYTRKGRVEDREDNQNFQSYMDNRRASRERSGAGDDGPLVAIKDPTTGQPKLVPRREAVGQSPASTRDQALTEGQSNAAGFADRMQFNEQHIRKFDTQATSRWNQVTSAVAPNEMLSEANQSYTTAKKNWIAATLRKESGAAISQPEYAEGNLQYFPQPGESPAIVEQKRQLRAITEAAMRRSSGSAGVGAGAGDAGGGPVQLIDPSGVARMVPPAMVDEFLRRGGKRP